MPALTAAQIETKIANLNATYDTLSAEIADSMSSPTGASSTFKRLEAIRKEIEHWETKLARVSAGTTRLAVIQFGNPA